MNRYKIDPWYSERPGLIDNLILALRRSGYSAYAEEADCIITNATRPALLIASGYGQLLVTARPDITAEQVAELNWSRSSPARS